ncbi:hypothetical protein SI65_08666 [Aspergillus cristatus]|uniref:FAD-binding domain-containing protein n=1 Tax=Aspergillus cristatus TaxID=573508 RepID=A0A1E3B604_ASPCR|nr:hypothetical protein SI65_08666 [Aspergillus cristatus]
MPQANDTIPILIVGGGPSGLTMGYMLSQLGVSSLIIERYPTRLDVPKAHALSPRSLELCRQFGLDVNEIRKMGTSRENGYWVNFIKNLSGKLVGRLPYERMDKEMIHNVTQPMYEDYVMERVRGSDLVEIRKNHSFVGFQDFGEYALTTVEYRGTQREYTVKSNYVIACDGAKSPVRNFLEIESEGEDVYESMMTIHINADLRPVLKDRVGMLHWVMDPEVSGFIIGHDLSGNQVLICNFDAERHPIESWNEDTCRRIVNAAIGTEIPYDVISYRPWLISRKVAKQYRKGRVFLAGDAAHSFPPTGGLGLNSGLGDVHNLAYKLVAVYRGFAADSSLNSYEYDRRQVAVVTSQQSLKNGRQIFGLLKAMGTTDPDVSKARENLYRNIEDPEIMTKIDEGIEGQREHFDNLGLHIGYVYGDRETPKNASIYEPSCIPGARLPHAWIKPLSSGLTKLPAIDSSYLAELSPEEVQAKQFSTLDLCPFDTFTLIVDETSASHWEKLAQYLQLSERLSSSPKIQVVVEGQDFIVQPGVNGEKWVELMGLKKVRRR